MSSPYFLYLRSDRSPEDLHAELASRLEPTGAKLRLHSDDPEDHADVERQFGLAPNGCMELQPLRGSPEARVFRELLEWARTVPDLAWIVLLDFEEIVRFADGAVTPIPREREFFEQHVLPGYEGRVAE